MTEEKSYYQCYLCCLPVLSKLVKNVVVSCLARLRPTQNTHWGGGGVGKGSHWDLPRVNILESDL